MPDEKPKVVLRIVGRETPHHLSASTVQEVRDGVGLEPNVELQIFRSAGGKLLAVEERERLSAGEQLIGVPRIIGAMGSHSTTLFSNRKRETVKSRYYRLLKANISNWKDWDSGCKGQSFAERLEHLEACVEGWKSQ